MPLNSGARHANPCRGLAALLTIAFAFSPAARADDWPQWLGPQRDAMWRETGILEKFPDGGPKVLWCAPVNGGYSGPAVAGGKVFVMDRVPDPSAKKAPAEGFGRSSTGFPGKERVVCLNAADGKEVWKHEYDCPYTCAYAVGPRCTPTVQGGKVYTLGAEGNLFCLDAEKGTVLWSKDFSKDYGAKVPLWGHSSHPLVDGKKLICVVGGKDAVAVAFDKDTGKELWKALSANPEQTGYCPPTIYTVGDKRQLFIWHGESLNSLDPETGAVHWSEPIKTNQGMAISVPRLHGDTLFVTAYPNIATLYRVTGEKPEPVWKGKGEKEKSGIYSVFATPFIEGDVIYGMTQGGRLAACKADTGERLWDTLKPNNDKVAQSGDMFLVKNGDRFFIANEKGDLIIAKLTPQGYDEISRAHLLEMTSLAFGRPVVWSHPAFAHRCAFMRNDKEIICVSLAQE